MDPTDAHEFEALAREVETGFVRELWQFLRHNKKWWLLPIVLVVLAFSAFLVVSGIAPFIYTLF